MREMPPLSLYVHLPWCVRKCPYCDFNSHAAPADLPRTDYVQALLQDLDRDVHFAYGRPLASVFFGGGTPSLFTPEDIHRVLEHARTRLPFAEDAEVTLEANPGTIERGRFAGYRQAGINRVSLGAQSFNVQHLKVLGRIHGAEEIEGAVQELCAAGIANFNLDLMYGLPQQSEAEAAADIAAAIALQPAHISHYQLTLEPGTVFYHQPPPLPDSDLSWSMQQTCQRLLSAAGYEQYEVSAYARDRRQCKHNLNYWRFGDYLGIGAGAHGKVTAPDGGIWRTVRTRQPREYMRQSAAERLQLNAVDLRDLPFEYMLNRLRLREQLELREVSARCGVAGARLERMLADAAHRRLMESPRPGTWQVTELGWRFLNDLQALFLPARPESDVAPAHR